jgi:hypothetical protein
MMDGGSMLMSGELWAEIESLRSQLKAALEVPERIIKDLDREASRHRLAVEGLAELYGCYPSSSITAIRAQEWAAASLVARRIYDEVANAKP